MKIKTKIFWSFFAVSLVMAFLTTYIFYLLSGNVLKKVINSQIEVSSSLIADKIDLLLSSYKRSSEIFTENITQDIFTEKNNILIDEKKYEDILKKIKEFTEDINSIYRINILNKDGIVLISTDEKNIGIDKSLDKIFLKGKETANIEDFYFYKTTNSLCLDISVPIIKNGIFVGMVIIDFRSDDIYSILSKPTNSWYTEEIYLVNKDFRVISPTVISEDIFLKTTANTENIRDCIKNKGSKKDNNFLVIENYKGDFVIESYNYIPQIEWCVVLDIKESEANIPLINLLSLFFIAGLFFVIAFNLISNFIGRSIFDPILRLKEGINNIEKEKFDYDIRSKTNDEIGELSQSFADMVDKIKKSKEESDLKVKEQTKEIKETSKYLEQQQTALLNVLEDVEGEKEKTQREKEKLSIILQSIGDGVFVVDTDLKVLRFNKVAEKISGFLEKEVVGKKYDEILNFESEDSKRKGDNFILKALQTNKIQTMEEGSFLIQKDGNRIPVDDSAAPIIDEKGNTNGVVVVFRDVSLTRKVDKMKSEFVSIASHQLRTPLTGIQWITERLLKKSEKFSKTEKDYLNDLYFSSKKLSHLVDDLLSVSRIEGKKLMLKLEKIDFIEYIDEYLRELKPIYKKKNLIIEFVNYPKKLEIFSDRNSMRSIVQSIISNAIEYTLDKGKIKIEVNVKKDNFVFEVSDTGIGIPKEDQDTIFEKFTRGSNAQTVKTDGTGLGLYITKQMVELLGGKIWFESEEDKGTSFFIKLPIKSNLDDNYFIKTKS